MARARQFPHEPGFSTDWRGWPARMVANERALLYWWISRSTTHVDELWYDVTLDGENPAIAKYPAAGELLNPIELRTWYALNARRADAIARTDQRYRVVELRDHAGAQTIGETLIYNRLARDEWPTLQWDRPLIVARKYASGITRVADQATIHYLIAPSDLYDPVKTAVRYVPGTPRPTQVKP